jgi:hypothetical protein
MLKAFGVLLSIAVLSGGWSWMAACGSDRSMAPTPAGVGSSPAVSPEAAQGTPSSQGAEPSTMPVLSFPSLRDGDTLLLPAELPYEIEGFASGLPQSVHLQVVIDPEEGHYTMEIPLDGTQGVLLLTNDKQLTGQRDVIFQLVDGHNVPYPNPQSRLALFNIMFIGRR